MYNIDINSWHFRMLVWLSSAYTVNLKLRESDSTICNYTRLVMGGIVKIVVASVIILVITIVALLSFGDAIAYLTAGFYSNLSWVNYFTLIHAAPHAVVATALTMFGTWTAGIFYIHHAGKRFIASIRSHTTIKPKQPGIITTMYRSWKDKFCFKFQLVDGEKVLRYDRYGNRIKNDEDDDEYY